MSKKKDAKKKDASADGDSPEELLKQMNMRNVTIGLQLRESMPASQDALPYFTATPQQASGLRL